MLTFKPYKEKLLKSHAKAINTLSNAIQRYYPPSTPAEVTIQATWNKTTKHIYMQHFKNTWETVPFLFMLSFLLKTQEALDRKPQVTHLRYF